MDRNNDMPTRKSMRVLLISQSLIKKIITSNNWEYRENNIYSNSIIYFK